MTILNLRQLTGGQDVPRVFYRPLKVLPDRIYFEKVQGNKEEEWTEGIYRYDPASHELWRVDRGEHFENPSAFDIEAPGSYEDILALQKMHEIYYGVSCQQGEEETVEFYRLDLKDDSQDTLFQFGFDRRRYYYKGMDILTQGYFIFSLGSNDPVHQDAMYDKVYLADTEKKRMYEIFDPVFKMTSGKIEVIGTDTRYLLVEEYYLSEEEEKELLCSSDVELAMELPADFEPEAIYRNSLSVLPFENFVRLVKAKAPLYQYQEIDRMDQDGLLRIIGETEEYIYFKKALHEFVLRESRELTDRLKIGREEVFRFSRADLRITKVLDVQADDVLSFEEEQIYRIKESFDKIEIYDAQIPDALLYGYEKAHRQAEGTEYFYDLFSRRYLVVGVFYGAQRRSGQGHLKVIDLQGEMPGFICNDLFMIQEYLFIG